MNRRAFLAAGLLSSTALAPAAEAARKLTVVYIGGWDCEPCTRWKNNNKAQWVASPEYEKVQWVEVDAPKLKEAYQSRYWPDELKRVLEQLPRKSGTPRFLIVRDGKVLQNQFGGGTWPIIVGDIRKYID
jgi:hypothetical protein